MTRRAKYEAHIEIDGRKVRMIGRTSSAFTGAAAAREAIKRGAAKLISAGDNIHAYTMNRATGRKQPVALPRKGVRR